MKKIIAILGSQRKGGTYDAVIRFEEFLQNWGPFEFENIFLSDCHLEFCRGCKLCFDKGESYCPLHNDRDRLIGKLETADGIIFATPNYSFQVSARMKNLFDRLAFIFHRPRYFGKTSFAIVSQGIWGGGEIVKYLSDTGENFGFHSAGGCVIQNLEPVPEAVRSKNERTLRKSAQKFARCLNQDIQMPGLFRLMLFRLTRTTLRFRSNAEYRDFSYYAENGWFISDYYYPVKLDPFRKALGAIFDIIGQKMAD